MFKALICVSYGVAMTVGLYLLMKYELTNEEVEEAEAQAEAKSQMGIDFEED